MSSAVFDIEANGLLLDADTFWCGVIKDVDTQTTKLYTDINCFVLALSTFRTLIGHGCIDYDFPLLRKLVGWEYHGNIFDTLVVSRLQHPEYHAHSVAAWGERLGLPKKLDVVFDTFSYQIYDRCLSDVEIQYQIYKHLISMPGNWEPATRLTNRIFYYLNKQETYGWYIDRHLLSHYITYLNLCCVRISRVVNRHLPTITEKVKEFSTIKKKDGNFTERFLQYFNTLDNNAPGLFDYEAGFTAVSFRKVSLDKPQEVKDFLLSLGWVPEEWNTDKNGNPTSPKLSKNDSFEGIDSKLGKLIVRYVQCKQRRGILEGLLEKIRPDGRLSQRVSGLTTTSRLRHADIVNMPSENSGAFFGKKMRRIFRASPGFIMIGVDSKGNQIRQLAARMQDDAFTAACLSNDKASDPHSLNQKRFKISNRTKAKNVFYGLIFGAGDKKLGKYLDGTIRSGTEVRATVYREMPTFPKVINDLTNEWRQTAKKRFNPRFNSVEYYNGTIRGIDGRPVLIEKEHMILCYALQSDEAIQMGAAYVKTCHDIEQRGYKWGEDWGMLIWYHDEFQLECRPEIKDELATIAKNSIEWAGKYFKIACPHEGEIKFGYNWAETH